MAKPSPNLKPQRGEIWLVDFEPQTRKEEPGKSARPALVVQSNMLNHVGHSTTVVIPTTSRVYRAADGDGFPLRVALGKFDKLSKDSDLLIDQIRTVANQGFVSAKPVAVLSAAQMKRVEEAMRVLYLGDAI